MLPGPLLEAMVELPQVVAPQAGPEPQVQQRVLQEALMPVVLRPIQVCRIMGEVEYSPALAPAQEELVVLIPTSGPQQAV